MHLVDWVPTLLQAAGVKPPKDLDGVSMWDSISNNITSKRNTIVHNIDEDPIDNTLQVNIYFSHFLKGRHQKKKIENFGGNVLKGGRGSFQKPNFIIPLIWEILGRREGVKSLISQFF